MPITSILDLGSLKLKLTIFEGTAPVYKNSFLTLLGKDLTETGELSQKAFDLLNTALAESLKVIDSYPDSQIQIIGTEALRKIKDIQKIQILVNQYFPNHQIRIIEQKEEGSLLFQAVEKCFDTKICLCDIGGGSVQILYGDTQIEKEYHTKTGTYTLQQQFSPKNDVISDDFSKANKVIQRELDDLNIISDVLIFGSTCMQDFIKSASEIIDLGLVYDKKFLAHDFYVTIDGLEKLLAEVYKYPPDSRRKFYPAEEYFAYGADYLVLNLILIAKKTQAKFIYPTNFNTSYAFIKKD